MKETRSFNYELANSRVGETHGNWKITNVSFSEKVSYDAECKLCGSVVYGRDYRSIKKENGVKCVGCTDARMIRDANNAIHRMGSGHHLIATKITDQRSGSRRLIEVYCNECAKDPELHGDGKFLSLLCSLENGQLPCGCAKNPHWTRNQYEVLISRKAKGKFDFTLPTGKVIGTTDVMCKCNCGHIWTSSPMRILGGAGCPMCSTPSFDSEKKGFLYLVKWSLGGHSFLKFGITNREVLQRIKQQSTRTKYIPEILTVVPHNKGVDSRKLESVLKAIQKEHGGRAVNKSEFGDGYTETISLSAYDAAINAIDEYCFGMKFDFI